MRRNMTQSITMTMGSIEQICWQDQLLCHIIRSTLPLEKTTFFTPDDHLLQVGYVVHEKGHEIPRHYHRPVERTIVGTPEVLLVREGHCEIDIYNDRNELVTTREVSAGDLLIVVSGGHGFRMLEDTVILEVKQGPYGGVSERERF